MSALSVCVWAGIRAPSRRAKRTVMRMKNACSTFTTSEEGATCTGLVSGDAGHPLLESPWRSCFPPRQRHPRRRRPPQNCRRLRRGTGPLASNSHTSGTATEWRAMRALCSRGTTPNTSRAQDTALRTQTTTVVLCMGNECGLLVRPVTASVRFSVKMIPAVGVQTWAWGAASASLSVSPAPWRATGLPSS